MNIEHRIAQQLGQHATAVFFATLAVVLAAVCASWLVYRRIERGRHGDDPPPPRLLIVRMLVGLAIAAAAGMTFAELADELALSDDMGRFDTALTQALRQHAPVAVLQMFALVTRLGDVSTLTVLCVVVALLLLAASHYRLALAWVLAVAGNGLLNTLLKALFERVRPVHEHGLLTESGWSFPSGHSSGSVVAYGMLAYVVVHFVAPRWQLPLLLLAAMLALTVGFSRVFLQVHYLSDVMAGFASGLLWLTICIASSEWLRLRRSMAEG